VLGACVAVVALMLAASAPAIAATNSVSFGPGEPGWQVPAGVSVVHISVRGGAGGDGFHGGSTAGTGGAGALIQGDLNVSSNSFILMSVGGAGTGATSPDGWCGFNSQNDRSQGGSGGYVGDEVHWGGDGGRGDQCGGGGGGGGGGDTLLATESTPGALPVTVALAGGGGGGGGGGGIAGYGGGNGANAGLPAPSGNGSGGSGPGSGGGGTFAGNNGAAFGGTGSSPGYDTSAGGGGGGGGGATLGGAGGGAGGAGAGGGGGGGAGNSVIDSSVRNASLAPGPGGDGSVTITWKVGLGSSGPSATVRVPRLRGKTLAEAKVLLKRRHLKLGKVLRVKGAGVRVGSILLASPNAGTRQEAGTPVTVWIRKR
jgi:PASTA domain